MFEFNDKCLQNPSIEPYDIKFEMQSTVIPKHT